MDSVEEKQALWLKYPQEVLQMSQALHWWRLALQSCLAGGKGSVRGVRAVGCSSSVALWLTTWSPVLSCCPWWWAGPSCRTAAAPGRPPTWQTVCNSPSKVRTLSEPPALLRSVLKSAFLDVKSQLTKHPPPPPHNTTVLHSNLFEELSATPMLLWELRTQRCQRG